MSTIIKNKIIKHIWEFVILLLFAYMMVCMVATPLIIIQIGKMNKEIELQSAMVLYIADEIDSVNRNDKEVNQSQFFISTLKLETENAEAILKNEEEHNIKYLDIPLSEELQEYTLEVSLKYEIQPELIFAMMSVESDFTKDLISKTNDYGLMQINKINHSWLQEEFGIIDFLDPEQNILCGVVIISELYKKYEDIHKALMAYNMGERGAKKHWNSGTTTSKYSRKVVTQMKEYL